MKKRLNTKKGALTIIKNMPILTSGWRKNKERMKILIKQRQATTTNIALSEENDSQISPSTWCKIYL